MDEESGDIDTGGGSHAYSAIRERRTSAQEWQASPRRAIPTAVVVLDADNCLLRFNPLAGRIFGLMTPDHGRPLATVPCTLELTRLAAPMEDVRQTGEPSMHRIAHGGRPYAVQVSAYRSESAARCGVMLVFTELEDLVHAGQELSRGLTDRLAEANSVSADQHELRQILGALPMMPFVVDADGVSTFYGEQWSVYLGVPVSELLKTTSFAYVHPDDRERARHVRFHSMKREEVVQATLRWRRHDGEYRWFSVRSVPLVDQTGKVIKHFGCCVDVHEEHQLREDLRATLHSLELSHQGGRVTSWTAPVSYTSDHRVVLGDWQPSAAAWELLNPLLGPEHPAMQRAFSSMHPEDRATVVARRDEAVSVLRPLELTFRTNPDAGPVRWLLSRGGPIFDAEQRCVRYAGMLVEFTAQKQAEKARDETARRLEHATKIARVGFFDRDLLTGRGWNDEQAAHYLGLPPGACRNDDVMARLDPSERGRVALEEDRKRDHQARDFEAVHKYLIDGEARWLRVRAEFDYEPDGRASRMSGSYIDVSELYLARERIERQRDDAERLVELRTHELRQKERHLAAILEGVPCALGYWDRKIGLRFVNRAFIHWFGLENVDLDEVELTSLWNAQHREPLEARLALAYAGELQSFEVATKVANETCAARWAHAYLLPDIVPNTPDGMLLLLVDISDLKNAEWRAEAATRSKGQFLANMSHEIRTPLTAVLGFAELGAREGGGDPSKLFSSILSAGRHLLTLIDDVLDFSRIEAGKLEIKDAEVDLASVESQLLDSFARVARDRGVQLSLREGASLPRKVRSDGARIAQLLINLVSNALKFTEHGHVRVTLDYSEGALELEVEDTGFGISEQTQHKLFQPFEQGVQRSGPRASGTGLGLAICKRIVGLMAGTLELRSTLDVGTSVRIRLPCLVCEPAELTALRGVRLVGLSSSLADELLVALHMRGLDAEVRAASDWMSTGVSCILTVCEQLPALASELSPAWLSSGGRVVVLTSGDMRSSRVPRALGDRVEFSNEHTAPLVLARLLEHPGPAPTPQHELARLSGVRVLAVEDNAINRLLLTEVLRDTGAELACVEDGEQALAQLAQHGAAAFDIVLCDVQLPGIDGYETTRRIRALSPALPVLGLTANAYDDARKQGLAAGMVGFVTKPYDIEGLVHAIEQTSARDAAHQGQPARRRQ